MSPLQKDLIESLRHLLSAISNQSEINVPPDELQGLLIHCNTFINKYAHGKSKGEDASSVEPNHGGMNYISDKFFNFLIESDSDQNAWQKYEQYIQEKESIYRTIINTISDGYWLIDKDLITLEVNDALCGMLGYSKEEMLGKKPFDFVDEKNAEIFKKQTSRISNTIHRSYEIELIGKNGRVVSTHFRATTLIDSSGKPWAGVAFVTDLSHFKRIETELEKKTAELKQINMNLERRIDVALKERGENEQLLMQQSRLAEMGQMIAVIAHQWRQPLATLSMMVQEMEDAWDYKEIDDTYINNYVEGSLSQIQLMSTTIDDFRNFYKTKRTKEYFDIRESVESVVRIVFGYYKKRHLELIVEASESCSGNCQIFAFRNEFEHVIMNLLNNSRDAIEKHRLESPSLKNTGKIRIKIWRDENSHHLEIADDGGGVDDDNLEKIFNPDFTTKGDKGTGIGLHMTRLIVERNMKGSVNAVNNGQGLTVSLVLPVTENEDSGNEQLAT